MSSQLGEGHGHVLLRSLPKRKILGVGAWCVCGRGLGGVRSSGPSGNAEGGEAGACLRTRLRWGSRAGAGDPAAPGERRRALVGSPVPVCLGAGWLGLQRRSLHSRLVRETENRLPARHTSDVGPIPGVVWLPSASRVVVFALSVL